MECSSCHEMKGSTEFKTYVNYRSDKRCLDCCKNMRKLYYQTNKDKILKYQKDYYLKKKNLTTQLSNIN
jgi:hypothetical protein